MTLHQPFAAGGLCITTNDLRLNNAGMVCSEGVGAFDQLLVTATDPVSGDVEVSAGHAYLTNDNSPDGGMYHVYNDAPITLAVPLNSSGVDRADVVWLQVCDTEYGGTSEASAVYDDDNPTATPPVDGCTYYLLSTLVIPNGAGSGGTNVSGTPTTWGDTDSMVTDERTQYVLCGGAIYAQLSADNDSSIAHNTYEEVVLDVIDHLDSAFFSVAGSVITVLQDGLYEANGMAGFITIGTGGAARLVTIFLNDTDIPTTGLPNGIRIAENRTGPQSSYVATPTRSLIAAQAGDTFKLAVFQDSGFTSSTFDAASFHAQLTVRKIG